MKRTLSGLVEAGQVYEKALALNPKIGVKRRLTAVSKLMKAG